MRIALVSIFAGCSFAGVRPPALGTPMDQVDCESPLPAADLGLAVSASALGGVLFFTTGDCRSQVGLAGLFADCVPDAAGQAVSLPMIVIGAVAGVSALYGYATKSACHHTLAKLHRQFDEQLRAQTIEAQRSWTEALRQLQIARAAAANAECAAVWWQAGVVSAIDATVYERYFVRDPALARCLGHQDK